MKIKQNVGVHIEVPAGSLNLTGTTLLSYADRNREAALVLLRNSPSKKQFDPVPYFLLCLSLELQMKAFLWLKDGIGHKTMKKKYAHDIEKLWRRSKKRGIKKYVATTPLRDDVIALVGPYYKKRQLNYVDMDMIFSGYKKIRAEPRIIPTLNRLTKQLSKSLRTPILRAS